jgi:hypothetical protein
VPDLAQEKAQLVRRNYEFCACGECPECGAAIEWWWTSRGKLVPLTAADLQPHWKICGNAFKIPRPGQRSQDRKPKTAHTYHRGRR